MAALNSSKKINEDIRKAVEALVTERDNLREQAKYAQSTILQLEAQNLRLDHLLTQAQACLQTPIETVPAAKPSPNTTWIRGIWLSSTANSTLLAPVETAWQKGDSQQALVQLHLILNRGENLTTSQRVETKLLHAAIMCYSGRSYQALDEVEEVLKRAEEKQLSDLVGKAQFVRGRCCLDLERYADARWCFALAAHTRGYERVVESNLLFAERKINALPTGHVGTRLGLADM